MSIVDFLHALPHSHRLRPLRFAGRLILPLLLLLAVSSAAVAQSKDISGMINNYLKVTAVQPCQLTVNFVPPLAAGTRIIICMMMILAAGTRIIIMQMNGAPVDADGFWPGSPLHPLGKAGYWEINTIPVDLEGGGNKLPLKKQLDNPGGFDVTKAVQVIVLPEIPKDAVVTETLMGMEWNIESGTGGVIALEVPGTLTLNDNIDATGIGFGSPFRALHMGGSSAFCASDVFNTTDPTPAVALKGEGIGTRDVRYGYGAWGNAGGGGSAYNAGGGGGGNYGAGGYGGNEVIFNPRNCPPNPNGGEGGLGMDIYNMPTPNLMMGGSGGQGHQNNGQGGDGAKGGGIIIVIAGQITGSGRIISNGHDAQPAPGNDGAGGGGAGGTIALISTSIASSVRMEAKGGKGGNMEGTIERGGPGGGGGGGVVLAKATLPASAIDVRGGAPGVQPSFLNNSQGATAGEDGGLLIDASLRAQEGNGSTSQMQISANGAIAFCKGESVTLSVNTGPTTKWFKEEEPSWTRTGSSIVVGESGTYIAEGKLNGCDVSATKKVTVWNNPLFSIGSIRDFGACGPPRIRLGLPSAGRGTPPYEYLWEIDDPDAIAPGDETLPDPWATPTRSARYKVTVTDANGCKYVEEYNYRHAPPILYKAPDMETCFGTPVQIGVEPEGGTPTFAYQWDRAADLDDPTAARPTVVNPTANARYIVKVTDYNGCVKFDTLVLTVKPLPVTGVSPNAVVCAGAGTQLTATGGTRYSWAPAAGLSCTDCASPMARPAATTTYTVTITDAKGCSRTETVTVAVRSPKLSSVTATLDFGTLAGCQTSAEMTFYLRNDDVVDLTLTDQSFQGSGFTVVSPGLPATIKGQDSVAVTVRFAPGTSGPSSSRLTLTGDCGVTYTLDLTGTLPTAAVAASVGVINFGQSLVCSVTPHDTVFTVTNTGTAPLTFDSPVIAPPFQLLSPSMPLTIPPGESREFRVRYNPGTTAAIFSQDLELPYTAGDCSDMLPVRLNATNIKPLAASDQPSITFPELVGCNVSSDDSVVITNTGDVPIDLRQLDITAGFRVTSALPATPLLPGETRTVVVRFQPSGSGTVNGLLRLLYGECNDTIAVTLSGSSQGVTFATSDSVNFGELVDCATDNATMNSSITYNSASTGGATGTVEDVLVTGPFTTTLAPGQTLNNGVPQQFQVTFTPTGSGDATGTIELTLQPCDVRRTIYLTGRQTDAVLAVNGAATVNFGPIPSSTREPQTIRFRNDGTTTLRGVTLAGITPPFTVISTTPTLPATLAPGQELVVVVEYLAESGRQTSVLQAISEDPCALTAEVQLVGDGDAAATTVTLESFSAPPGERRVVPLLVTGTQDLPAIGVTSFTTTIRYRRSLLVLVRPGASPVSNENLRVDGTDNQYMLYTFTGPFVSGDTLSKLTFIAALGDAQATPVTIESFAWSDPSVSAAVVNATFTLEELCVTGESRLINAEGALGLKPARPNPVNTTMEIEYELVEDGQTELFISNMQGERVAVLVDDVKKPGRYVLTVDASRLPSGSYIYVLQTPTQRLTRRLEVVK